MEILGVDNVLFAVGDLAVAGHHYGTVLELPVAFSFAAAGIVGYRLGDERPGLMIRLVEGMAPGPARDTPRVWLEVADARAVAVELERRGVTPVAEPFALRTGWAVEVADPWGNVLGFTDYTADSGRGRSK